MNQVESQSQRLLCTCFSAVSTSEMQGSQHEFESFRPANLPLGCRFSKGRPYRTVLVQRNCSSAESSSANDARKTPSKHARRRTTEGETTSTTQDDAQHHREHDTIPSHNTIMPAKTQPTTDICGFSRKQDAIIINPDERSSARWARDCAYPAHYVDYETYPEDVGVPEGRLSEEKQLPANIVKLGPHSVEGPKRPCPHCEDGGNFFTKYIGHKKNTAGEVRLAACASLHHAHALPASHGTRADAVRLGQCTHASAARTATAWGVPVSLAFTARSGACSTAMLNPLSAHMSCCRRCCFAAFATKT